MLTKLVLAEGSRDLIIAFSGRGVPAGRFQPYKQLVTVGTNVLFFNCSHDDWYQSEMDAIREEIARIVGTMKPERVLYYGFSMGGFPALTLGSQHDDAQVLALSTETALGLFGLRSSDHPPYPLTADAEPLVASSRAARIVGLYGEFAIEEAEFSWRMHRLGAEVRLLPCSHMTEPFLCSTGAFQRTVAEALTGASLTVSSRDPTARPENAVVYPALMRLYEPDGFEPSDADWRAAPDNWPWQDVLARHMLLRLGDYAGARKHMALARRALEAAPMAAHNTDIPAYARYYDWLDSEVDRHEEWARSHAA